MLRYRYPGKAVKPKWRNRTTSHRVLGILEPGKVQEGPTAAVEAAVKGGLVELVADAPVTAARVEAPPAEAPKDVDAAAPEAAHAGRRARGRQ